MTPEKHQRANELLDMISNYMAKVGEIEHILKSPEVYRITVKHNFKNHEYPLQQDVLGVSLEQMLSDYLQGLRDVLEIYKKEYEEL